MKIGLVSREYPPFFGGGVGTYVHQVSRALATLGHEVHVFTVATGPTDRSSDPPGVNVHRTFWTPPDEQHTVFTGSWFMFNRWLYATDLFREALLEFLEEQRLDIVEFPEWEAPGWPLLLDWRWKTPSVVNCHTPTWLLQELNCQPPLAGQYFEKLELALADAVCAPCTPMALRIAAGVELERPPRVVHHPYFAADVLADYVPPHGKTIVYVGRLEHRKGVIDLLAAAPLVLAKHPDARFVLVGGDTTTAPGGGSMREYLIAHSTKETLARVEFVDNCPLNQLAGYYRQAAFCAFPSIFENFPNVCLEAMAAGRTAVVSADSGMVEMIGEAGITVTPQQPAELAAKIIALLDDPERAAALGKQAYHRVREVFAPARQAQSRVEFYESVLARTGPAVSSEQRLARVGARVWRDIAPELVQAMRMLFTGRVEYADPSRSAFERLVHQIGSWLDEHKTLRIALYGAGQHTHKILPFRAELEKKGVRIERILDDNPSRQGQQLDGIPITAPADVLTSPIDLVVLSSDAMEPLLWKNSKPLREAGVIVVRLYARYQDLGFSGVGAAPGR